MSYYVSHMTPIQRARVHKGTCIHCNEGKGQSGQHRTGSGNTGWSDAFPNFAEADAHMRSQYADWSDIGSCGYCKPERS